MRHDTPASETKRFRHPTVASAIPPHVGADDHEIPHGLVRVDQVIPHDVDHGFPHAVL
jgi:hypothetical protein